MLGTIEAVKSAQGMSLFREHLTEQRVRLDRMFSKLMLLQWMAAILVAVVYSPIGWADKQHATGGYLTLAIVAGGILTLIPLLVVRSSPGSRTSRQTIAICQILFSSLFIHLSGGRIETHFHIFVSLAWLGFYLDWEVLVTATVMVALDHLLRGLIVPESVYGMVHASHWRFLEHALWVAFEDVILFVACQSGLRSLREGADRQAALERLSESEQNKTAALEMALAELRGATAVA